MFVADYVYFCITFVFKVIFCGRLGHTGSVFDLNCLYVTQSYAAPRCVGAVVQVALFCT
jgi:hypothetical protein